jgi:prepilin-type N-terminal cleavage/methylation domain-containing protein
VRHKQSKMPSSDNHTGGFSLIELLVVIAIISLSLAISLPALHLSRALARRVRCQSNLRQIALGCHMYLDDNNQRLYQADNSNHDFGGWQGIGPFALSRPINPYVRLPLEIRTENGATVFRCLRRDDVSEPSRLLLVGDNNWLTQWSLSYPSGSYWHGRLDYYNAGVLDGHI